MSRERSRTAGTLCEIIKLNGVQIMNNKNIRIFNIAMLMVLFLLYCFFDFESPFQELISLFFLANIWFVEKRLKSKIITK